LLAFRVESGDSVLKEHLLTTSKKATYVSKEIQNELIQLCGNEILKHIVRKVRAAKYFAIIADETSDSSPREQLFLCIRYVDEKLNDNNEAVAILKEEFVCFIGMDDLSANSVATQILAKITEMGLNIENCVGQGYDGTSAMSGHKTGVQVLIREKASAAVYVHCASHCLNLVLNHSSQQLPIRNMFTTLSDVINFFNYSPKRRDKLDVNLLTSCETRFIQRHDAIMRFADNFDVVLSALQDISKDADIDAKTRTKAMSLINAISSSSFVVSLAAVAEVRFV